MKVLFVCHGNICRSPMGEMILKEKLRQRGIGGWEVDSAAGSTEELGNPVYPPARRELARRGMACLIISSDLEEVIGLCRRVAVMREGTVAGVLADEHVNEKEIMYLATGVK